MVKKLMHRDQRGFTLIEMLVVLVIIGLISGGITAAIIQILTINHRASNHMICVRQVQQAGKDVSKDTLQAQNVTYTENPHFLLSLIWTDWDGAQNAVNYTIEDSELVRTHDIDGDTFTRVIAQYIDSDHTSCNWTGQVLIFTVTATRGSGRYGANETRVYEIKPRPG